jgi:hypothetical protein
MNTWCSIFGYAHRTIDLLIFRLFTSTVPVKKVVEFPLRICKGLKYIPFCIYNKKSLQSLFCFSSSTFLDFIYICVLERINKISA